MKNPNIIVAFSNISSVSESIALALKSVGVKAKFIGWTSNLSTIKSLGITSFYKRENNFFLNFFLNLFYMALIIIRYDILIFHAPETLFKNNFDLKIYKLFGIRVIGIFDGCNFRDVNFKSDKDYACNNCLNTSLQKSCSCINIEMKSKFVKSIEKKVPYILCQKDNAKYLEKSPQGDFIPCVNIPSDAVSYLDKYDSKKINISHIPSDYRLKGSNIIIPIMKKISNENAHVGIKYKGNKPHAEVLEQLEKTHILIDNIGAGYGVLALEAMTRGCVVLTSEMPFLVDNFPTLPIIHITPDNLENVLLDLITNPKKMRKVAKESIDFAINNHSFKKAGYYYREHIENVMQL